jgi:hypothetical protein
MMVDVASANPFNVPGKLIRSVTAVTVAVVISGV